MEVLILLCVIAWYYIKNKKRQMEENYISRIPQTKNSNSGHKAIENIKGDSKKIGSYGEDLIYDQIKVFKIDGGKILRNIYIPKEGAESTEIDLILICTGGIYILESKNYSGWIFGGDNDKMWTQSLTQGRKKPTIKNRFLNPIYQNKLHIECLKKLLNDYASGEFSERKREELCNGNFFENKLGKQIPFYSVIVFSERCKLKNINLTSNDVFVVQRNNLRNFIYEINKKKYGTLNRIDMEWIYGVLQSYTQVSEEFKARHIENIKSKNIMHN